MPLGAVWSRFASGFVATNGNTSVSASAVTSSPESYTLSCVGSGFSQDVVEVSVGNQAPDRPTINQTGGNNEDGHHKHLVFEPLTQTVTKFSTR